MTEPRHNGPPPIDPGTQAAQIRAALRIDTGRLEDECARQARLIHDAGMALAHAVDLRDRAKAHRDTIIATASLAARDELTGGENKYKPTEAQIEAMIANEPGVTAARAAVADHEREAGELEVLDDAIKRRSEMLGLLVNLYVNRYHGGRIEERQQRRQEARSGQPPRRPPPPGAARPLVRR